MSFSKDETKKMVVDIISDKLNMPADSIKSEATFKDLGADSLDVVEIIMNFEEIFGIEIKDEEAEKISSVGQAINLIHTVRKK
jgi:acyl carrier protein